MHNPVRVELTPYLVPADGVYEQRADAVERLGELGQIDPSAGTVATPEPVQHGWLARVNGAELIVDSYAVEPDGGRMLVSLVLSVDSMMVGAMSQTPEVPSVRSAVPEPKPKNQRRPWGTARRDPREGLPGWSPEPSLGEQVAGNAEAAAQ